MQTQFAGYRLLSKLAVGGMGEIYAAAARGPGGVERRVAIKVVRTLYRQHAALRSMFLDEAKVCFLLTHPNIVQTYEIGQIDGHYFLAMEFVDGLTLQALIDLNRSRWDPPLALYLAGRVARGLSYAHQLRDVAGRPLEIVHRDISPSNILISTDGQVKVADFGIAKSVLRDTKTAAGTIKGKVAYMAPEQLHGDRVGPQCDVYALGVVLYELIAGKHPFGDAVNLTPTQRVTHSQVSPIGELVPSLPRACAQLIVDCMAEDPKQRPADGAALRQRIDDCVTEADLRLPNDAALAQRVVETKNGDSDEVHPFDRALGIELSRVAAPGAISRFSASRPLLPVEHGSHADADRHSTDGSGGAFPKDTAVRRWFSLAAASVLLLVSLAIIAFWSPQAGTGANGSWPSDAARQTPEDHEQPGKGNAAAKMPPASEPVRDASVDAATEVPKQVSAAAKRARSATFSRSRGGRKRRIKPQAGKTNVEAPGFLSVNSEPWSNVYIDGVLIQGTPLVRHKLSAGRHRLRLLNPQRQLSEKRVVLIKPGREHRVIVELSP